MALLQDSLLALQQRQNGNLLVTDRAMYGLHNETKWNLVWSAVDQLLCKLQDVPVTKTLPIRRRVKKEIHQKSNLATTLLKKKMSDIADVLT